MEIVDSNVNQVLGRCLNWLEVAGIAENSRNGPVIVSPEPVLVTYTKPCERVLFSPTRDANPFFHLMESLWMLAGHDNITWPAYFNKRMMEFSDDGVTQWGAYGARWRYWFKYDQLQAIITELKCNPESRRCVLTMWDGYTDFSKATSGGRDVPCNTHVYFDVRDRELNMTVCNRSNDLIWGLAGANAVHFSILHEYLAANLKLPVGQYRQFTNNLHAYQAVIGSPQKMATLASECRAYDYYDEGTVTRLPLVRDTVLWDVDLAVFLRDPLNEPNIYEEPFFRDVAAPMYHAWYTRKQKLSFTGMDMARMIVAPDWRRACMEWIERREARRAASA